MAKKETEAKSQTSSFLSESLKVAQEKFGGRVYMSRDANKNMVGIPLPSLALMYLFDADVLLLGKVLGIAGQPQTNKSALGYEVMRWFVDNNGYGYLAENEAAKFSPILLNSLAIRNVPAGEERVGITHSVSTDQAQEVLLSVLKGIKKASHRNQLCSIMLDSISGADMEETNDKLDKEGSAAGRAYPVQAASWTNFFKSYCPRIVGWPVNFMFINHLKESPETSYGPPKKNTPGGWQQRFSAAWYIYLYRTEKNKRMTFEVDGQKIEQPHEIRTIRLEMSKSSLGTEGRYIPVDFIFYKIDGKQTSFFDWDDSTAWLLAYLQDDKTKGVDKGAVRDIIDVTVSTSNANSYSSKRLGMKGVSGTTLGRAVHADKALMESLLTFLGIHRYIVYDGSMPGMALPDEEEIEQGNTPPATQTSNVPVMPGWQSPTLPPPPDTKLPPLPKQQPGDI